MSHSSVVWRFFDISAVDSSRAKCKLCNTSISRGGKVAFCTSNLRKHLEAIHCNEWKAANNEIKASASVKQATVVRAAEPPTSIVKAFDSKRPWDFNDERSRKINVLVGEMIARDNQPFNIVNNEGFRRLVAALEPRYSLPSDSYFRTALIPELYDAMSSKLASVLAGVQHMSLTTDEWSTSQCTDSLLSVTAHWIDDQWQRRSAVIAARPVEGSHTAENLGGVVKETLSKWGLMNKVHVCLRDNGKNIVAGLRNNKIPSIACFAHTLQLCVKRGLGSQRAVIDALAVARQVASHFSHSVLAKEKLEKIQATVPDLPVHRIIQDVQTRWNSTFYMVQRLVEQKKALILYAAEDDLQLPSNNQWLLLERLISVLSPIERATRDVSAEASSASDVIPMVIGIKRSLQLMTEDAGVQTMKTDIIDDLDNRFAYVTAEPKYTIAMLVDPRYRGKLLSAADMSTATRELTDATTSVQLPSTSSDITPDHVTASESAAPPAKRACIGQSPLDLLANELQASSTEVAALESAADEIARYLRQNNIALNQCPLTWWHTHGGDYSRLREVARRYLSAPSTSVPSERLFSDAGELYSDNRSRLSPEKAEMLLFIKYNISHL